MRPIWAAVKGTDVIATFKTMARARSFVGSKSGELKVVRFVVFNPRAEIGGALLGALEKWHHYIKGWDSDLWTGAERDLAQAIDAYRSKKRKVK